MIANPDLVRYACIAHHPSFESSTILAEFNSADSNLQQLAQQCLQLVPPHHYIFSHSYRNQSYTFLLHNGFVYFGIFDSNMVKSDQILFLGRLKETIDRLTINGKSNYKFSSYCLQGELHPIFHKLMSKSFDFDALPLASNGVHDNNDPVSNSSKSKKILSVSFISASKIGKGLKKKKMSEESWTNSRDSMVDGHVSLPHGDDCDAGEVKSREIIHTNESFFMDTNNNNNNNGVGRHNKAKKIWRRHVWIVLVLDLAVCLILFGIWLFVCRGFECIGG